MRLQQDCNRQQRSCTPMTTKRHRHSIDRCRALFVDAVRRGDAGDASSVYDVNAHLLAPSAAPMVGREEIRAYWQAGIDSGVGDVSLVADEITRNDGLAYETGGYE